MSFLRRVASLFFSFFNILARVWAWRSAEGGSYSYTTACCWFGLVLRPFLKKFYSSFAFRVATCTKRGTTSGNCLFCPKDPKIHTYLVPLCYEFHHRPVIIFRTFALLYKFLILILFVFRSACTF